MMQHLLSFSVVISKQLSFANAEMHGVGQMKLFSVETWKMDLENLLRGVQQK